MSVGWLKLRVAIFGSIHIFEIVNSCTISYKLTLEHDLNCIGSLPLQVRRYVQSLRIIDSFIKHVDSVNAECSHCATFIVNE